ncbi:helicase-associated domain-containing protein [Rudaeicoccus suwonensis]|uniref:helicase-associated domain-containing protein n=1 Tax=Rudaeicoccus suwonensis TaxID=657409 RepID=UPI0011A66C04|nr:helicase-associated domain-containing protein [Rudaeicoccus suwonensis]
MAHARSLADDIRARSDAQLADLLRARPDLVRPAPADLGALASRAATVSSTRRALESLRADELRVLEAVVVVGADGAAAALGASARAVKPLLTSLWAAALLWRSPDGLRPSRGISDLLAQPARLGPTAASLGAPDRSADAADAYGRLSQPARTAVDRLLWVYPRATLDGAATRAVGDEIIAAGLAVAIDGGFIVPREVGLVLRGGRLYQDGLTAPTAPAARWSADDVNSAAAAEVLELLWRVEELAHLWEHNSPRLLRSGGLSVRDHRAVATALDADLELAAFVLEIAYAAGLVGPSDDFEATWLPTRAYDEWAAADPAERWQTLAVAWRDTTRAPSRAGAPGERGVINVLSDDVAWPFMRQRRHDILSVLYDAPEFASADIEYVDSALRWRRPMRLQEGVPTHAAEVLREAAWLGITGRGTLSAPGRAIADGSDAAAAMAATLPEPIDHVLVQADLTAVAPGPLTEDLRRLMQLAAVVESRGGATVYRFTETSIRQVLDTGLPAAQLLESLSRASRTPLPQPLEYLIADVARRHGQTRIGAAGCYLRNDDTGALDALVADRSLSPLQLHKIAPTVVVSPAHPGTVLEMIRQHGYSPVVEGPDGHIVHAGREHPRAPNLRPSPGIQLARVDEGVAAALVARLRVNESRAAATASEREGPRIPETDPTETMNLLQDAVGEGLPVWIGYVDSDGEPRRALFRPNRVEGGRAIGSIGDSQQTRTFVIHRISGVVPA